MRCTYAEAISWGWSASPMRCRSPAELAVELQQELLLLRATRPFSAKDMGSLGGRGGGATRYSPGPPDTWWPPPGAPDLTACTHTFAAVLGRLSVSELESLSFVCHALLPATQHNTLGIVNTTDKHGRDKTKAWRKTWIREIKETREDRRNNNLFWKELGKKKG